MTKKKQNKNLEEKLEQNPLDELDLTIKLPSDTYQNVKDILENKAGFLLSTRLGQSEYRNFRYKLSKDERMFLGETYLTNPHLFKDPNNLAGHNYETIPPFDNCNLAKKIAQSDVVLLMKLPETKSNNPFIAAYYYRGVDYKSRSAMAANIMFLNEKEFGIISKILKDNPEYAHDIFYKMPILAAKKSLITLDEQTLNRVYDGYGHSGVSLDDRAAQLAAIYYADYKESMSRLNGHVKTMNEIFDDPKVPEQFQKSLMKRYGGVRPSNSQIEKEYLSDSNHRRNITVVEWKDGKLNVYEQKKEGS